MKLIKTDYIEEFKQALSSMIDSTVKAAAIYVKAIDEDPSLKEKFMETFDGIIPASAWSGFEAVGRKAVHPQMLLGGVKNARYIKRLSYSDQERIFKGHRFQLLTAGGDSIQVDPREISKEQAEQLFDNNHIRTLSEQMAYVKSLTPPVPEMDRIEMHAVTIPYKIAGHKVYMRADTVFTKRELTKILEAM